MREFGGRRCGESEGMSAFGVGQVIGVLILVLIVAAAIRDAVKRRRDREPDDV